LLRSIGGYFLIAAILLLVATVVAVLGPVTVLGIGGSVLFLFVAALAGRLSPALMALTAIVALPGMLSAFIKHSAGCAQLLASRHHPPATPKFQSYLSEFRSRRIGKSKRHSR
jgi:hypothetical protein